MFIYINGYNLFNCVQEPKKAVAILKTLFKIPFLSLYFAFVYAQFLDSLVCFFCIAKFT